MRGIRRFAAVFTAVALLSTTIAVRQATPALAEDEGIATLASTLAGATNSLQSWTSGLDTVGKLAEALPLVQTSPGSVLGFPDLLQQAFAARNIATATTDNALNFGSQNINIAGGRAGTLSSTLTSLPNGDKQVDITVDVSKTVNNQPLNVAVPIGNGSNAPQSAFTSRDGVNLTVRGILAFRVVWDSASDTAYVVVNQTTPSIKVQSTATFADKSAVKAAIGILGVSLVNDNTTSLDLAANFAGRVADPDNDGRVAFVDADHSPGELAANGSLAGLVSFGPDETNAGHLNADLHLNAAPATSFSLNLPAIDATIQIRWADISNGQPQVTPTGIGTAGKFLNLTPRDLADGLGQLVTTLTNIQRAKFGTDAAPLGNLDLPFVKGTLADAIQLNESLKKFLEVNTISAAVDKAKAGQPTFVSIQEMLDRLNTATSLPGGSTIGVSNVGFDNATSKLAFKLTLHRAAPADAIALDALAAAASGGQGATFEALKLTDNSKNWTTDQWAGRRVVAGSSGAEIQSNTAHELILKPIDPSKLPAGTPQTAWYPTLPAANSPYVISGMSADVGVVALGNSLQQTGRGVLEANGVNATAQVTPSYDAFVTMVLDLQDPIPHDPPLEVNNGDGTTHVEAFTPTAPNRVLIRTGAANTSFTADFPIRAGIDLFANAGFLQVQLQGAVNVCHPSAGANCDATVAADQHMLSVGLNDLGDLTFGQVVDRVLHNPSSLIAPTISIRAGGSVTAAVPGMTDFFPTPATASFTWNNLNQTSGSDGPQFDTSQLTSLVNFDFDPANRRQLYSIILKTLQTLRAQIADAAPTNGSIFSQEVPVLGRSLSELLQSDESGMGAKVTYTANTVRDQGRSQQNGNAFPQSLKGRSVVAGTQVGIVQSVTDDTLTFTSNWGTQPGPGAPYVVRSELDDAISILEAQPTDNLQSMIRVINDRLKGSTPINLEYRQDASVGNTPSLVVNLDWQRNYNTSAPVQFDFSLPIGDQHLAGAQGEGLVSLGVNGRVKIGLVVPLAPSQGPAGADDLKILDNSSIGVGMNATATNVTLATTIGPLSLSLGDPTGSDKATAKANYSLALAKSGAGQDGTATTFGTFLTQVGATVNSTSQAVDCGLGGATPLALCAKLPLYISTNGGQSYGKLITTDGHSNDFVLRLPKTTTDYFSLTPGQNQVDGHDRLETPNPDDLAAALQSQLIDFARLDGIDGFLDLIVQSLNTASFGGKLPLIGEDLQQGADFIGNLKRAIDSQLGSLAQVTSVSGLRTWVNDQLKTQLQTAGMNPDAVSVETECSSRVASAPAPTVTPAPAGGSTTYRYKIVSYVTDSQGNKSDAQPGAAGVTTTGQAVLGGANKNTVTWNAAAGANGYKVYRQGVSPDTTYHLMADTGTTRQYVDTTPVASGAAPTNPNGPNPKTTDCDRSNFDSVKIRLNVSQGNFAGDTMTCPAAGDPHACISKTVPLDIGVPGLSLRAADPSQGPHVDLGWRLHLAFGISRSEGFFVDTKDGDPQPEFAVGLNFTLPSQMRAQLAFINLDASNCDRTRTADCDNDAPPPGAIPPAFGGTFKIDLKAPSNTGHLLLADLSNADLSTLFDVKLNAAAHIDWLLKATVDGAAGFPGIQTEFRLDWVWSNAAPGTNNNQNGNVPLAIQFRKVQIDAGEAFGKVVGPIINEIKKVTGPLDPIIKTLYAPIPVLSDLSHLVGGDDVTMISIAKSFSTLAGGPDLTFVDTITKVIQVINSLPTGSNHVLIPIGSFSLVGDRALSTTSTPDNADSLIDQTSKTLDAGAQGTTGILGGLDQNDGNGSHVMKGDTQNAADAPTRKAGFQFPVFEKPASLFNVLMGGDVTLVTFDSGPLKLGFDWLQQFGPVYAPPPVLITLHGSASVTLQFKAGFDTFGLRKAFDAARAGTLDLSTVGDAILQSLFFATTDNAGKPLPVVTFRGEIAAGAAVSAVVITVGIEGGVGLTVSFLWNDPNHDGKFRISEFLQSALNNPICLFTVSGRLYVFLKLYVTIGVSIFSVTFSFTIVDVTLLDFSAAPDCAPPPPKLGAVGDDGHTLVVYAAALGHESQRGHSSYESNNQEKDTVKITELHDYGVTPPAFKGVAVEMLGIRNEFLNTNIDRVVVDGRGYTKPMNVTFIGDGKQETDKNNLEPGDAKPPTLSFSKDAIVFGGDANDSIKTGIGNSWVDGGPGDDTIVTADRTVLELPGKTAFVRSDAIAWVAGGGGNDSITVGNGPDWVSGDGTIFNGTRAVSSPKELKNSKDPKVNVDSGNPTEAKAGLPEVPDWTRFNRPDADEGGFGEAATDDGDDILNVGLGQATVYGNHGNDTLSVGADDPLAKSRPQQAAMFTSAGAALVGGNGSDRFAGGSGPDHIYTGGQTDTGIDAEGTDDFKGFHDPAELPAAINIVDTGTGNDFVYGAKAVDRVTGRSTPQQVDDIRGGGGEDILVGGFGQDKVYGGPQDDYVIAEPSKVDLGTANPPAQDGFGPSYKVVHTPLPTGTAPSSKLLVGGLGRDHIIGGDGGAQVYGDQQTSPCGPGDPVLSDSNVNEALNTADDGNDRITGGAGVENVMAGGGNDNVDVKANNDLVCGESGGDVLQGGSESDQVWGGSGDDVLYGDTGMDFLYGNADTDVVYGGLDNDTIEGNNGTDYLFGGDHADLVVGGTQAAGRADVNDYLFGDTGDDILIGDNGVPDAAAPGFGKPLDLGAGDASLGGADKVWGGDGADKAYGGLANDYVDGGRNDDYIEGNNATDTLLGNTEQDDIIGGSSQVVSGTGLGMVGYPDANDIINGNGQEDVILGDNGSILRTGPGTEFTRDRGLMIVRTVTPYDWVVGDGTRFGGDTINGDGQNDAVLGQAGSDTIHGNGGDDYLEGNQSADSVFGDADQDDILGGSSQVANGAAADGLAAAGEDDTGDTVLSGGDASDVVLGDNGFILRTSLTDAATVTGTLEDVTKGHAGMSQRRINLYDVGAATPGGGDVITGDGADDALFGQVGTDTVNGNGGDDYIEGDQGVDTLHGDLGQDDILGGGALVATGSPDAQTAVGTPDVGDVITGDEAGGNGGDPDVILGDDGSVLRIGASPAGSISNTPDDAVKGHAGVTQRRIRLYDLTDAAVAVNSGPDDISAQGGDDAVFGQGDDDRIKGGLAADHLEGGQAADFVEGDQGDDDVIGGSAVILGGADLAAQGVLDGADVLFGGDGDDLLTGDNAVQNRVGGGADANYTTKFTDRLTATGGLVTKRWLRRLDLSVDGPALLGDPAGRYGGDRVSGGTGVDVIFGQDGGDFVSGGPHDDYAEGNGGADVMRGDRYLTDAALTNVLPPAGPPETADRVVPQTEVGPLVDTWVGTAGPVIDLEGPAAPDGQDDLIGGTTLQGFRDGDDRIEGNGEGDFQLGDNGALVRTYGTPDGNGVRKYQVFTKRYPSGQVPANAVVIRHNDPTIAGMATTRFCTTAQSTCEVAGSFGGDFLYGDAGDDTQWGQDGNDTMRGGADRDDMYGELGDDWLFGDAGQDAILGDRGGVVDTYVNQSGNPSFASPYTVSVKQPPAISYKAFTPGTYDRRTDLLHDINGDVFVGAGAGAVMPHDAVNEGGVDHVRGGGGHDNIHLGYGDDLANGDSGGDAVFGDHGADVLWGGKGCDPLSLEDYNGTCTDPASDRGDGDMYVDYLFGGKGGTSQASLKGDAGSDLMDWQPRGSYPSSCSPAPWPQTLSSGVTIDPCDWMLMTATYNDPAGTDVTDPSHRDNQTHHGVDWMYGGWDRDVMQADKADEGPNTGDRLLDWNGAYNLYSHCNPAYGGYNDVRELSPAELTFIQKWSYGVGIGQQLSDVTTSGTSAYEEVAIVYQPDMKDHGTGPDYPTTPGHFDQPNACSY